jgi:hypothetical protein
MRGMTQHEIPLLEALHAGTFEDQRELLQTAATFDAIAAFSDLAEYRSERGTSARSEFEALAHGRMEGPWGEFRGASTPESQQRCQATGRALAIPQLKTGTQEQGAARQSDPGYEIPAGEHGFLPTRG